jgi:hypothetical protein
MANYVVVSDQGPAWIDSLPMREQGDWDRPCEVYEGTCRRRFRRPRRPDRRWHQTRTLIVKSSTEQEVRDRLARDPWAQMGLLVTESIEEWEILLGNEPEG